MPTAVFASYGRDLTRSHQEVVRKICVGLEGRYHEVWFDEDDRAIASNPASFVDIIKRELGRIAQQKPKDRVLFFRSRHAVRLESYCIQELAEAMRLGIAIVIVALEPCPPLPILEREPDVDLSTMLREGGGIDGISMRGLPQAT